MYMELGQQYTGSTVCYITHNYVLLGSSMCQCGFASGKQSSDFVFSLK